MIDTDEYEQWDAVEMAARVRAGDVRAGELVEACRALIAQRDPLVRAVADQVEAPIGDDIDGVIDSGLPMDRVFAGVPFAVKELLPVPGLPWTMGSRLMAGNIATESSAYADRLRSAGLQVVGSTTSSEFGLLGSTESLLRGPTTNPWGRGLSAAGSSGGAAALVAAGIVPMAHANDAGGSIRVPASATGLFGFKPSAGRTVATGTESGGGLTSLVFDHCITRSVRDSAAMLSATQQTGPTATLPPVDRLIGPAGRRFRIGVLASTLLGNQPDPAVADGLFATAALCSGLGHDVDEIAPPPVDGQAVSDAFFTIAASTMAGVAEMFATILGRVPGPDEFEPFTLDLIGWAKSLPVDAVSRCEEALAAAAAAYNSVFEHVDVVLTPTLTRPPWPLGTLAPDLGRTALIRRTEELVGYTPIHNISGSPAMSVPLVWVDELPVGMHFAAETGRDALLLDLAFQLEQARPWRHRRPDLSSLAATA